MVNNIFGISIIVVEQNSHGIRISHMAQGNIKLAMAEDILRQVNTNKVKSLTLGFIHCHGKARSYGELMPFKCKLEIECLME